MTSHVDAHKDLHSEQGALRGEHPGRSRNPLIKVRDLAWLEFEKPDLVRAEAFARAFGFSTVLHTADELQLRGTDAGSPCVIVRRGPRSRFVGPAFAAQDKADVERLASATGRTTRTLPEADRRRRGGPDRSERDSGSRGRRHARAGRACPRNSRTPSTSGMSCGAPTPPSAPRASRPACSGWDMSCCRARSTSRH